MASSSYIQQQLFTYFLLFLLGQQVLGQTTEPLLETFEFRMPNVSLDRGEQHYCTSVKLDPESDNYIIGFKPKIADKAVHHMFIYGCEEPGTIDDVWDCSGMPSNNPNMKRGPPCRRGIQIIYVSSRNAPSMALPEGVGFHVGGRSKIRYISLRVDYAPYEKRKNGAVDISGFDLQYTTQPITKFAGVVLMGSGGFIQPNNVTHLETACKINEYKAIHPFAFSAYTNALGRVVSGYQVTRRVNEPDEWNLIGKQNPRLAQTFYPVLNTNITIGKGDILAARCTMVSNRPYVTRIGITANDEVCNFYVMYWTASRETLRTKFCFSPGAPSFSWAQKRLNNIPENASTL